MSHHIQPLIEQVHPRSPQGPQPLSQLARTLQHHQPDAQDMQQAIASGHAAVVKLLLESPALSAPARISLATAGLQAWSANPLASRQSAAIVKELVGAADVSARNLKGITVAEIIAPMLGNIEHEEVTLGHKQGRPFTTAAGDMLRSAWSAIESTGHDMAAAASLRQPSGATLEKWRRDRASAASASIPSPRP